MKDTVPASYSTQSRNKYLGNSLAVQGLGLCAFTAVARVQSLVGELKSRKPRGTAKKTKNKITKTSTQDRHHSFFLSLTHSFIEQVVECSMFLALSWSLD